MCSISLSIIAILLRHVCVHGINETKQLSGANDIKQGCHVLGNYAYILNNNKPLCSYMIILKIEQRKINRIHIDQIHIILLINEEIDILVASS